MPARLRRFTPGEVILSGHDAFTVLRFFSIEPGIPPEKLTLEDRAFVQALLVNAIDQSYDMGFVEALYVSVFGKTPASLTAVAGILSTFAFRATTNWFQYATADDLRNPRIYESIRILVKDHFASVWGIRLATHKLTY